MIQYVYNRYGRDYAAQVANVITYRGRSAVRDMARALGFSQGQQDAWSKQISQWGNLAEATHTEDIPEPVIDLAKTDLQSAAAHGHPFRRHGDLRPSDRRRLPGGVGADGEPQRAAVGQRRLRGNRFGEVRPVGPRHALGTALRHRPGRRAKGLEVDLAKLDLSEPAVYEMLQKADSVGVFQVESRAQMATLPRLKPRVFYDLVVEVALIRPGPIQGGSVHPYIKRRNGEEPVIYDHPSMESALRKTLGGSTVSGTTHAARGGLRGFFRCRGRPVAPGDGIQTLDRADAWLRGRFYDGMRERHGVTGEVADRIYEKLEAFANFGFPESHSLSFASLVFYSSWFKLHHPAAFCAALLRAQPMGFYSPQSLVADARRHGVTVHGPDANASLAHATLENVGTEVRLGLGSVRHIGDELAERIVDERKAHGAFTSLLDLTQRIQLSVPQTEALATAGALGCFGITRREGLWAAGAAATQRPDRLPGGGSSSHIPSLPGMTELELAAADVWATGVSSDSYPTQFLRENLDALGVVPADKLLEVPTGPGCWWRGR